MCVWALLPSSTLPVHTGARERSRIQNVMRDVGSENNLSSGMGLHFEWKAADTFGCNLSTY